MARRGVRPAAMICALVTVLGVSGCNGAAPIGVPLPSGGDSDSAAVSADSGSSSASSPSAAASAAKSSAAAGLQPAGMPGNWHLVFDDEFTGGSLDTARWSTGWLGDGITSDVSGTDCDDPNQVSVSDGSLALALVARTETCGGVEQQYATGAVNTEGKESFLYGAFEARIYLPTTSDGSYIANWPAWWADGTNWPDDGEMDILEGLSGVACYHLRYSATDSRGGCASGNFSGWHTYGADWENGSVTYYFDGYKVGTESNAGLTPAHQFLVLNYEVHKGSKYTDVPATMRVDYVRVWQH